jgi:hypothetical protein
MDVNRLRGDITTALNASGADAACHIPDFELAEILVSQVQALGVAVRQSIKQGYIEGRLVEKDELEPEA